MMHTLDSPVRSATIGRRLAAPFAAVLLFGCGGGGSDADTIGRDRFVDAYVDLRHTALASEDGVLSDTERADVLERNDVTAAQLTAFAEAHGADIDFMRDVWNDIEVRLDGMRPEIDP